MRSRFGLIFIVFSLIIAFYIRQKSPVETVEAQRRTRQNTEAGISKLKALAYQSTSSHDEGVPDYNTSVGKRHQTQAQSYQASSDDATVEGENVDPARMSTDASEKTETDLVAEKNCWDRMFEQMPTHDFFDYNRDFLNQRIGAWVYPNENLDKEFQPKTTAAKFYLALGKADLLLGKKIPMDLQTSLNLLYEVILAEPGNSAPLVFAAVVEKKMNNTQGYLELIKKAKSSRYFNSYATEPLRNIYTRVKSSSDYIQGMGAWANTPIPHYSELKRLLEVETLDRVAWQMVQPTLDTENRVTDADWFLVEYAVGRAVLNKLGIKNSLSDMSQMSRQKNKLSDLNGGKIYRAMRSKCDISALDPFVNLIQRHVQEKNYN